jgi:putative transposase
MKKRLSWATLETPSLSVRQKCLILGIHRSRVYYVAQGMDESDVTMMNEIGDLYALRPFQGYKRITDDLKELGYNINHKRVYRLMKLMGLQALYPKKNLSKRRHQDSVYPYLLKNHPPSIPHDCWCVDITYLKTAKGFVYLTALIDVVSRCVMGWHLSNLLDTESCLRALEMAIYTGYKPKIINSDQGCQFTAQEWLYALSLLRIQVSMDGKGRWADNIMIERFWRTLKYEEVYLKTYETLPEAREEIAAYIHWYNHKRRHSSLKKQKPYEVMTGSINTLCDNGENPNGFTPIPTKSTSTTKKLKKIKKIVNLSSKLAA